MVVRFKKKIRKKRGTRTCGYGSHKKHRGGGSRGGRGKAGLLKHKKSWMLKYEPDHFGKRGFKVPKKAKKEIKAITLRDLDILAKKLNKTEINLSELGFDKVLSTGNLTQALTIKAKKFTENAKKKIEEVGGKAIENV
ncbi:MAG: uL15m family ribosomal protein [Candidatus Aenigmatarchaeota archaeon]